MSTLQADQKIASRVKAGSAQYTRRRRSTIVLIGLTILLVMMILAGVGIGAVQIAPNQVAAILGEQIGITLPVQFEVRQSAVLMAVRLPRVLLGVLIGSALAISGAAIQGLFRNPLAAPGLIGISSGAALAAVSVIVLGATLLEGLTDLMGRYTLPAAAFVGGALTTLIVYRLASVEGRTSVATMLLAGVAINALAGAGIGLLTFLATDEQLRSITFWSLGSLGGATWRSISIVAPFIVIPILVIPYLARSLNALLLGEAEARHLGIDTERVKRMVVLWVALAVGAAVSVTGIIGFIGLIVPHLLRLLTGPDHRAVLPGSAMLGASLLLGADLVARTIVVPAELPIGVVTGFIGAPFFLWLLLRNRNQMMM